MKQSKGGGVRVPDTAPQPHYSLRSHKLQQHPTF